ncbi:transcription factor BIM2 isoform X2 [Amborella trichopoda]|uniref:transcription factor BIM2 isoform X2 n=1 Tax=Amborella trichopoda TaxID=13333 RepID=UPI0009BE7CBB|nr:transcription factor BIM2 isoform X2 [Amborella trichopoda]|eukprot:XP_020522638.1 transcription factor BIM2 isoform X2 [Amborella trichopoda]
MELPQPQLPFTTEGAKPTHDFLSLYNEASFQNTEPGASQGFSSYLKTQDFLQPLEKVGKSNTKGDAPLEASLGKVSSVEHVLPGGIGTYSISHISTFTQSSSGKVEKPVGVVVPLNNPETKSDRNNDNTSNNSSYGGGAFTLWEESAVADSRMVDRTGERHPTREYVEKSGYWSTERPVVGVADLPFLTKSGYGRAMVDTTQLSSSSTKQRPQNSQGFVEIVKSVKGTSEDDDDDEEEHMDRNRDNRKESSSHKGDLLVKVDAKHIDQRANTPRSKHSATEQRRRSKINDRFQILRDLVPHSDQKRDKASFLLEVIEYIQLLQEKVQKYESSYQGWNQDKMKIMAWKGQGQGENAAEHSQPKMNSSFSNTAPSIIAPNSHSSPQPETHNTASPGYATPYKEKERMGVTPCKPVAVPLSLQQHMYSQYGRATMQTQQRLISDAERAATPPQPQPQPQPQQKTGPSDRKIDGPHSSGNEQEELGIEGGIISVSSVYSQGLLGTLTQALQSSGLDLSQASISVQIDLGKRGSRPSTTTSSAKDHEEPSTSNLITEHSRPTSSGGDSEHPQKRPKKERDC